MLSVSRYRLSVDSVHEFYSDKLHNGVLKPENSYQIYIIKINNPEDRLYQYSELVLIESGVDIYYPIVMLNIDISSKYTAFMCDIKTESEKVEKDTIIRIIPERHLKRLEQVLSRIY
jgi:hypothetical protein